MPLPGRRLFVTIALMNDAISSNPPTPPERRWRFPVLRWLGKRLRSWRERHQVPFNLAIHMIGIPLAVAGVVLLFVLPWSWGAGAIVLGYFLQWLGHCVEGNDVGEWAAVKRLLGLPYVGVAPRWQKRAAGQAAQEGRPG
jgi:hypothetical protein